MIEKRKVLWRIPAHGLGPKNAFDDEPTVMRGWTEWNCDSDRPLHFALAEVAYSTRYPDFLVSSVSDMMVVEGREG